MRRMSTVRMDNRPRVEPGAGGWLGSLLPFEEEQVVPRGVVGGGPFKPEQEPMLMPGEEDEFRLFLGEEPFAPFSTPIVDAMEVDDHAFSSVVDDVKLPAVPPALKPSPQQLQPQDPDTTLLLSPSSPAFEDLSPEEKLLMRRKKRAFAERQRVQTRKQEIEKMKDQMVHLQHQYDALCVKADNQLSRTHPAAPNTDPLLVPPFHSLHLVTEEIKRLRRENTYLHERINQKHQLWSVMETLANEFVESLVVERPVAIHRRTRGELNGFVYVPYSLEQCRELISQHLQRELGPDSSSVKDEDLSTPDHLGWSGFRCIENRTCVKFDQTKLWPGTAAEVFGRSWNLAHHPKDLQRSLTSPRYLELLQSVSDDILIFRRISENVRDGKINHSVYMAYRVRRGDSFLNGLVTLPLWGNVKEIHDDPLGRGQLAPHETCVKFQKLSSYSPEPSRPDMMRVRHWGFYDCDTEDDARFWMDEVVDLVLRYEFLLLFPVAGATRSAQLRW